MCRSWNVRSFKNRHYFPYNGKEKNLLFFIPSTYLRFSGWDPVSETGKRQVNKKNKCINMCISHMMRVPRDVIDP